MKREILCTECAAGIRPMHPQDVVDGFKRREVDLIAKKPAKHGFSVNGKFEELRSLICDGCSKPITDGTGAVAVTYWNTHREGEPGPWEEEYKAA